MGRKPKYPEHKEKAATLMNELLDEVVNCSCSNSRAIRYEKRNSTSAG